MSVRVVAFDGTPVAGGAGMRVAVIERGDGSLVTSNDRQLSRGEMMRLIDGGYMTAIVHPIPAPRLDGVIVYRDREFVFPGVSLEDDVAWSPQDNIEIAYLGVDGAETMFRRYARVAVLGASAALQNKNTKKAREFARRGLMVVPGLQSSDVAAQLYGILHAAATVEGNPEPIRRELVVMLDGTRSRKAASVSVHALARPTPPIADARRTDRSLSAGATFAPRQTA